MLATGAGSGPVQAGDAGARLFDRLAVLIEGLAGMVNLCLRLIYQGADIGVRKAFGQGLAEEADARKQQAGHGDQGWEPHG